MDWAVFQYGVEGWTLKKSARNRIESFEMWCWKKMLGISWKEHRTNISILEEIGLERELMGEGGSDETTVLRTRYQGKCRKFGTDSLGGQCRWFTSPRKTQKTDNIEEWSGCSYIQLKEMSQDRDQWRRKTIE